MSEQQPLIEEPKATGPGKDPEICGTCRSYGHEAPYTQSLPVALPPDVKFVGACCLETTKPLSINGGPTVWQTPIVWHERPACCHYVHREIRRDR